MSNLFKKAVVFTDIHYGLKSNSEIHNNDCFNFMTWMVELAKQQGCETCLFLGDYHHHRSSINLKTLNISLKGLELLSDNFEQVYFIPGNHDLFYRDKRDIHSAEWAKHLPNINIVNDWFLEGNVSIVPWLVGDDYKRLNRIKAKYMFGHFELPHFKMNAMIEMPDNGTVKSEQMAAIEHVYSGHFHMRQEKDNITYVGNCFPHNFADSGDEQRGCMILEWDKPHQFYSWPDQPLYKVLNLSTLLDEKLAKKIIKPNTYLKVNLDIEISYEESNFIKETFKEMFNLREISLVPILRDQDHEIDYEVELTLHSVDSTVIEQLESIESDFYKKDLLMSIYNNL